MSRPGFSQTSINEVPLIGAEVFIEPGQTLEQIDTWFRLLKENGMYLTRIRLFESYMRKEDGTWDFTLFDHAYKAADKYGIKIYGNLFPSTSFEDVGGFKFPRDSAHLSSIAYYIKNLVTHFKQFKSCYGWVPVNEPGAGSLPKDVFTKNKFNEWKNMQLPFLSNKGFHHFDFAEERFLLDYNTWFLKWLTDEIHKYNPGSVIHVNNHALFQNAAEYNFPEWRNFLTSLGGSAHASWHFGLFTRDQYALAMAANSEMLRSGAGPIPWMMTELQGGNNTYSGFDAMCPTKEEIAQWLWITIGTESKGAIFWCLNPRASGIEAGEWALLDFQDGSSDRMEMASNIAKVVNKNEQLFANAKTVESGINILYVREAMWIEKKLQNGGRFYEGRSTGGTMKSALGYFEALSEMGIQSNFKEIGEFDFSKGEYSNTVIILSHQIAIPTTYWKPLEEFVQKGGKLIVDGLTGFYDEKGISTMITGFPFSKLFGGNIKEFKLIDNLFEINLSDPKIVLPAHLWRGSILPTTSKPISILDNEIFAVRNKFGKGEVLWIPTLAGLGSKMLKDYSKLTILLTRDAQQNIENSPFRFKKSQPGMVMKTMQSGDSFLTIIINKSKEKRRVELEGKGITKNPTILFGNKNALVTQSVMQLDVEESVVIKW